MPKPKDAESFDVTGERYRQHEDKFATLKQAASEFKTADPTRNFTLKVGGNAVTVSMHCQERGLGDPGRRAGQVDAMSKALDEYMKGLKRRFKELGGGTLSVKEVKSARNYKLDKVSINDRWSMVSQRTYEVDDLIQNPEED